MKKTIIVVVLSLTLGGILAYFIFNKSVIKSLNIEDKTGIAFQIGVYTHYESALSEAYNNNGIVIPDNNLYRVYITLLTNKEAIDKISNYYDELGLKYYKKEVIVSNDFIDDISIYEEMITKSNTDTYNTINNDILHTYLNYI